MRSNITTQDKAGIKQWR